ncbi:MAG: 2-oxo acid dehydrogenase subunit E2 [Chlamydiia bacterium]|nr:2-oxo acid dehydrogenase subunit E2 [Chlamydiia bacterium]
MSFTLTMPKLSPTMEAGTITSWLKKEGEWVEAGEPLIEVSTDKATVEYDAIDEGYLRKILVEAGSEVQVNDPIALFTEKEDDPLPEISKEKVSELEEKKPEPKQEEAKKPELQSGDRIKASPLAKKIAEMEGIDLSNMKGTGPGGRIVKRDLEGKKSETKEPEKSSVKSVSEPIAPGEEILSPIRKVIADRLQEAKSTIPHFYVTQEIDASPLVECRTQLSHFEHKISFNDLVVKGVAIALKEHPEVNSGFNAKNRTIIRYSSVDISVAVQVPMGLITPIVPKTDEKPIEEISKEIKALIQKAKEGRLQPHEFQGGSFTVSNLGMFGVSSFSAIINPPQAAILAVGGIIDKPVLLGNKVVPGKTMTLTLSVDHRVIDGVMAAKFLKRVQYILENPAAMIL